MSVKEIKIPNYGNQDILDSSVMFSRAKRTALKQHKKTFIYIWRYGLQLSEFHINHRYKSLLRTG